jgi:hypothetical protein
MLPRLPVVLGIAFLATLPALGGCSSSHRRDQFYGTDAGADYQIPDAVTFPSQTAEDASVAEAPDDADPEAGVEAGVEDGPAEASAQESAAGFDSDSGVDS